MNSGIYKISSKLKPERFYIGSTFDFRKRKREHFYRLKINIHENSKLQRHFNKYGEKELKFEILEYVEDTTKLIEREQFYIDSLNPYFNARKIAENNLGFHHSEETKFKIGKSNKGKKRITKPTNPFKKGHIPWNKGIPCSTETKIKISKLNEGKEAWNKGIKGKFQHSEETKRKISQNSARKGKPGVWLNKHLPEEARLKIGLAHKGKVVSEETKQKSSKSRDFQKKPVLQFDLNGNFIKEWDSMNAVKKELNFNVTFISEVCKGKYKSAYNFKWVFKNK